MPVERQCLCEVLRLSWRFKAAAELEVEVISVVDEDVVAKSFDRFHATLEPP